MKKNLGYKVLAVSGSIYVIYFFTLTSLLIKLGPEERLNIAETAFAEVIAFIPLAILFIIILHLSKTREDLFEKFTVKIIFIHILIFLMFMGIHACWQIYFNSLILPGTSFQISVFVRDILGFLNIRVLVYLITIGLVIGIKRIEEKENFELKESELKLKLQQAKMRRYELKLNPDIIYPTLNYVKEYAETKPENASQLILNLSKEMRILIDHIHEENILVKKDIDFFKYYFQSLNIRLEKSIEILTEVDEKHLGRKIPSLILLIPFFEKLFLKDYSSHTKGVEMIRYRSANSITDAIKVTIEIYPIESALNFKKDLEADEHLRGVRGLLRYYEIGSLNASLKNHTLSIHLTVPPTSIPVEENV